MDVDKGLPKVDYGIKLEVMESEESKDGNVSVQRGFQCCNKCSEWKEKNKQAEERFTVLNSEIKKKISELESLEGKLSTLQLEKLVIEEEVQSLRKRNGELEEKIIHTVNGNMAKGEVRKRVKRVVDLTEDDKDVELMIENKVLDCEKKKAESEVEVWKVKCKELEFQVTELEQHLTSEGGESILTGTMKVGLASPGTGKKVVSVARGLQSGSNYAVTPLVDTASRNLTHVEGGKKGILSKNQLEYGNRARKRLFFGEVGSPSKKIAPSTPAGVRPAFLGVINISDSDGEANDFHRSTLDIQASKKSTDHGGQITLDNKQFPPKNLTRALDQSDEDDVAHYKVIAPSMSTPKRKRASNMVTSDSESDTDDQFPLSRLRTNPRTATGSWDKQEESVGRRRLVTLRKLKENCTSNKSLHSGSKRIHTECIRGMPTNKISSDDETEKDESDIEGSNLGGFIVGDSDFSECDDASQGDDTCNSDGASSGDDCFVESDDASDSNIDYGDIIARIGRRKDHKVKWVFQGDMLAAFGKDPELCMKAVCALYRQQTSEEKFHKATIVRNNRGFSQVHAARGTKLGEFLTDGDPQGDLKKSVGELEAYDPKGLELCRALAEHYSNQLFEMFQNNEDPLWPSLEPN